MWSQSPQNHFPEHIHPAHSTFYCARHLERNAELGISLHIFEQNFLTAAVIKFRGPAVGVAGDSPGGFEGAVIFQKIRDPSRPERVRRIVRWQSSLLESSFKHVAASVRTSGRRDNLPVLPKVAGNKGESGSPLRSVAFEVLIQELVQLVVDGELFFFAALLFKAK